jgi:hypothetical protein
LNYDSQVNQRLKLAANCLFLILAAFAFPSFAQETNDTASEPFSPAPYRVGERLTYNVSFSNFNSAAHVELLVAARGTFFGREALQLKSHVETTGVVNAALFAINNDYVTYVDPANGLPFHSEQVIRESSRTAETAAEFNSAGAGNPAKRRAGIFGNFDFVGAIYRLRALPLSDGSSNTVFVKNGALNYQVELRVTGHELVRTSTGSANAIVSEVRVRSDSGGNSYNLKAYFSSEQRHVPLLVIARLSVGELRIELAGSSFVASPAPTPLATPIISQGPQPGIPRVIPPASGNDVADLKDLPFKVGERLNYRVYLPNIPAPVATATFQVRARSRYFDHDGLFLTVTAQTTNALQKLFVASDTMSSYVDPKSLLPFRTEVALNQGRTRVANKLTINQDYGTVTTETGEKIEIPIGTHDYLSYFYVLRTFDLTIGKSSPLSILVDNRPKTLVITPLSRETVQLGSQSIPAIQISLTTDDAQRDKFQLRGWVSADKRRLPLRLTAMTELGLLRADLDIITLTPQ